MRRPARVKSFLPRWIVRCRDANAGIHQLGRRFPLLVIIIRSRPNQIVVKNVATQSLWLNSDPQISTGSPHRLATGQNHTDDER